MIVHGPTLGPGIEALAGTSIGSVPPMKLLPEEARPGIFAPPNVTLP